MQMFLQSCKKIKKKSTNTFFPFFALDGWKNAFLWRKQNFWVCPGCLWRFSVNLVLLYRSVCEDNWTCSCDLQDFKNIMFREKKNKTIFWWFSGYFHFSQTIKRRQLKYLQSKNLLQITFPFTVILSVVLMLIIFVWWSMEKMLFWPIGFFAAVPKVATRKNRLTTILPIQYPVLVV